MYNKVEEKSTWLLNFKSNTYSQQGEDGVIEKILSIIPKNDKYCVKFGAWDGLRFSNTRKLVESKNYYSILIEGNKSRFKDLKRNFLKNPKVITINRFVGFNEEDNLDNILEYTPIPLDLDFLSIDIDGNDYHVWKAISKYKPKVVCIKFNPTIPTEIRFVQPPDLSVNQGASLLSLVELGKEKGYELISCLPWDAFFVRNEYFKIFQIEDNCPEILRIDLDYITYLFIGYDGKVFLQGSRKVLWHGIELNESRIQPLPKFLRKYPGNYSKLEIIVFLLYLLLSSQSIFIRNVLKYFKNKIKNFFHFF